MWAKASHHPLDLLCHKAPGFRPCRVLTGALQEWQPHLVQFSPGGPTPAEGLGTRGRGPEGGEVRWGKGREVSPKTSDAGVETGPERQGGLGRRDCQAVDKGSTVRP